MSTLRTGALAAGFVFALGVAPSFAQSPAPFQFQPALPQTPRGSGPAGSGPTVPVVPQASAGPQLRGISVVLLEGDLIAVTSNGNLPAAAAKALADMKDFLPYKGYRVLDTQWTLGSGKIAVRLRGTAGHEYDLELTSSAADTTTRSRMQLLVDKGLASPATLAQTPLGVSVSSFRLREAVSLPGAVQGQPSSGAQGQRSSESRAETDGRVVKYFDSITSPALIETAFRMDVGETVVVGTSRLQGDKALIVLLTAVAK